MDSKENYFISIIIPIFNSEDHIRRCLNNLINQSLDNIEILCVDYGSEDNSIEIIKEYSYEHNHVKLFSSDSNINSARNKGILNSNGEYLLFLNPMDWMHVNSCENIYNEIKEKSYDILFFKSSLFNDVDNSIYEDENDLELVYNIVENNTINHLDINNLIFSLPYSCYNKIYNRSFLKDNNLCFLENNFSEYSFFYKVILNANKLKIYNKHIYIKKIIPNEYIEYEDIFDDLVNMIYIFKELCFYDRYEKDLLNYQVARFKYYLENSDSFKDDVYTLIRNIFIFIEEQKSIYARYATNLNSENIFFFRNILKTNSFNEYELLCQYNKIINENENLKFQISNLKREVMSLNNKISKLEKKS